MSKKEKKSSISNLSNQQSLQAQPINDALENVKAYDACKELKLAMDGGASESDLSDLLVAKLIKCWLLYSKQEFFDIKNGIKQLPRESEAVNLEDSKGKAKDKNEKAKEPEKGKPGAAAPAGKKGAAPAKGAKASETAQPSSAGSDSAKRKNKLRDRTGGKEKVVAIGDEPTYGPDVYYFLKDFDSPGLLISLREELDVPIDAIFRIEDTPTKKTADLSYAENPNTNQSWLTLNNRAKILNEPAWRKTVWLTIPAVEFKEIKEIFDNLATKIYAILERRKIFLQFYKADNIINIPTLEINHSDLRYYEYLISATRSGGKMNIDIQLALFLEYFMRAASNDDNNQLDFKETNIGYLKQLFDSEIRKVVMALPTDNESKSQRQSANGSKLMSVKIVDFYDISKLHSYFMSALKSINLDAEALFQALAEYYPAGKYSNFLETQPAYRHLTLESVSGEFMKIQTEFFRVSKNMMDDTSRMEKFLTQLDLEELCKSSCELYYKDFTLDDWRWFGNMSYYSLIQAIQIAECSLPQMIHHLPDSQGKLLLIMKSPGPLGCLEYQESERISVRTKVDFSKFYDLYDPNTGVMDGEVAHATAEAKGTAYLMNDASMKIIDTNSYLYPDNNIIVKVTKRASHTFNGKQFLSLDLFTKIWWNNNFIRYSSGILAKTSPALVARFYDGSAFSILDSDGNLNIKFSDEHANHFIFQPNGNIICKSYKSEDLAWNNKIKVHSRLFFPTGVVVKYFENKDVIVMYPDGSTATQTQGKEWVIPDSSASEQIVQNEAVEHEYPNGKTIWTKANLTVITKDAKGNVLTEHADGTNINSSHSHTHEIGWLDEINLKITFKADGEQIVDMGSGFQISRKFENGKTTSVFIKRADMNISIEAAGNTKVKLSSEYFNPPPEEHQNCFDINWRQGTLNFADVRNHVFTVSSDGVTKVTKPDVIPSYPGLSFGGKLTKSVLKIKARETLYGNTPEIFVIYPNRQGGLHFKRDSDMARYFQSYSSLNLKTNEENMNHPESVTISSIREFKIHNSDQNVIQYRQLTRLSQLSQNERDSISAEYSEFKEMLKKRHRPIPISELGETEAALQSNYDGNGAFTLGSDKEATQLAIILQYMDKEDLSSNAGLAVNNDVMSLLRQAKELKTKSTTSLRSNSIKTKNLPKYRKSIMNKPPKYFDSPEGQKFLGIQNALNESKIIGASCESFVSETTSRLSAKRDDTIERVPDSSNGSSELPAPSEHSQLVTSSIEASKEALIAALPELPKVKPPKTPPPKVRKLRYPSSILGTKPGLIPNTKHLKQEANSHRQLNTASTAEPKKKNPIYGVGEFIVLPGRCSFGRVEAGETFDKTIELTNVGLDSLRFSVKLPANELIFVHYKHGSVAPGMRVKLTVSLSAKNDKSTILEIDEVLKVITEAEILNIPIKAKISPKILKD
ncbi:hypothetical protein HDV06_003696 [Boothiomyces sp. JEL0866]|nr:hypothetical protein HDV06_003696 [Boothiomyces sp. JEL0866]